MWGAHNLRRGRHKGLPDHATVYVDGGYTDKLAAQIAKEQDTTLEVLKHLAAYYRV